ncbi:hypothetical protein KL937_004289 [Ogataea polymorpha]|nr:hypothetical protein KL937_004289 [Ogataea polymorpha]KAG7932532.1 hypothetical protein KL904_004323 [Ogataea polymorpha]
MPPLRTGLHELRPKQKPALFLGHEPSWPHASSCFCVRKHGRLLAGNFQQRPKTSEFHLAAKHNNAAVGVQRTDSYCCIARNPPVDQDIHYLSYPHSIAIMVLTLERHIFHELVATGTRAGQHVEESTWQNGLFRWLQSPTARPDSAFCQYHYPTIPKRNPRIRSG